MTYPETPLPLDEAIQDFISLYNDPSYSHLRPIFFQLNNAVAGRNIRMLKSCFHSFLRMKLDDKEVEAGMYQYANELLERLSGSKEIQWDKIRQSVDQTASAVKATLASA